MPLEKDIPVLRQHKLYLEDFWSKVGGISRRYYQSSLPKPFVISELIRMGEIKLNYKSKTHTRRSWNVRKKKVKKFNKFTCCFACGRPAYVRHHIIWLSHGGRNQKNNIIGLCYGCHALIHPWLQRPWLNQS